MLALLLTLIGSPSVPAAPPIPETIRVGLGSCVGHPTSITLKANEPMIATDMDTKAVVAEIETGKEITLRLSGKLLELETPVTAPLSYAPDQTDTSDASDGPKPACEEHAEVPPTPPAFKGPIRIASRTAEGIIEIVSPKVRYRHYRESLEVLGGSRITVVNELSVEHYVCGAAPTEIPASFHPEAQKALVVAARTYAVRSLDRHKAEGFNICDTIHCQGFAGVDREAEWVRRIVEATRGEIITYRGEPIFACYSADCGGMTQNSEDSGMIKAPYLRSVSDSISGEPSLVVNTRPATQTLEPSDQSDLPDASDIEQPGACPATAMTEFEKPADGDYCRACPAHTWTRTYSAADLERVFNRSSSTKVGKLISMEFAEYDCSGRVTTIIIKGEDGEKRITGSRFRDLFGLSTIMSTRMALTVTSEGNYVIEGRGYGHGVGLCQWGANGLAKSDPKWTYIEILRHYYTDIEIKVLGEQ